MNLSPDSKVLNSHDEIGSLFSTSFTSPVPTLESGITSQQPTPDVQEPSLGDELNSNMYLGKEEFERYMDHFIVSLQKELAKPSS